MGRDGEGDLSGFMRSDTVGKLLLIILCFFFPFIAVLIRYGPCMKVVWALLLQLLGHFPGVIYGIYQVTKARPAD